MSLLPTYAGKTLWQQEARVSVEEKGTWACEPPDPLTVELLIFLRVK